MGLKCYICNRYDPKTQSLFRIPNRNEENSERWRLWLKILEESEQNIHKIRVCSKHFLNKKPAKKEEYLDVDWVPTQNLGRFEKNKNLIAYYFKAKKGIPATSQEIESAAGDVKRYNQNYAEFAFLQPENETGVRGQGEQNFVERTNQNDTIFVDINQQQNELAVVLASDVQLTTSVSAGTSNSPKLTFSSPLKRRKIDIIEQKFLFPMAVQTDITSEEIDLLFQHYKEAVDQRNQLLLQISTLVIDVKFFENNDTKTRFYTGLTTWKLLDRFFKLVEPFLPEHGNSKLSPFQMLALMLMKLRLNSTFKDLGYRFQVDPCTASKYFYRCLYILYKLFFNSKLVHWPDRSKLIFNTPSYFRSTFKESVTVIIDCFELFIERSSVLRAAAQAFSKYKHHATLKYLIGISTTGAIIFISVGFGGRASDKEATLKSGFLDKLKEGDLVLADKGFLIKDEVEERKASLRLPCFVRNGGQLDPKDVEETRETASIRIHVERLISVVRQKFNICSDVALMSAISKKNDLYDRDAYDKIIYLCCCLVNICPSVVRNDFEI